MFLTDAQRLVGALLAPLPLAAFMARLAEGRAYKIDGPGDPARIALLGAEPGELLLGHHAHLADRLTFHAIAPSGPPPAIGPAPDERAFRDRIAAFHARGYSVRFPELRPLSPPLDRTARAFEVLLHQPVSASAFWSRSALRAPVHYDEHDIVAVQLRGTKTWHLSQGPSPLCTGWQSIPGPLPMLGAAISVTMRPGDVLYVPRGLPHTVDGAGESLHVAIGFTPLTVRDAVIALVDQLSESERGFRATIGGDLALRLLRGEAAGLMPPVANAVTKLREAAGSAPYFAAALQRRSARAIGALDGFSAQPDAPAIGLDTELRPRDLAFCHLSANADTIDLSYPGGHIYVHRGAQESLVYIINAHRFRVRDIPGAIADDVRLALADRLLRAGYLEIVPG
ncbi:MAG: hypothetical protein JOY99_13240 [Sphingomonadaceae bacterium]|nr:hypothetical protein [Sphingomonadaceae bacterium]